MQTSEQRKNLRDFVRKLRDTDIPFKAIIQKNRAYKRELFCEFTQTVQIPDLFLYRRLFFTDRQINGRLTEANNKIPVSRNKRRAKAGFVAKTISEKKLIKIRTYFYRRVAKKVLNKLHYSFDIEATTTVKILNQIKRLWSRFSTPTEQDIVNNEKGQYDKYAEGYAINVADQLKKMTNLKMMNEVATFILEDDTHANILAMGVSSDQSKKVRLDRYESLKIRFDAQLKRELSKNVPGFPPPDIASICILPDARPTLINDLLPFVDPAQHDSLKALINESVKPQQPIICQCGQVKIGAIFYERVKAPLKGNRQIQADKTILAKWICQHFERYENGEVKKLSESTILNYLKNKGFAEQR